MIFDFKPNENKMKEYADELSKECGLTYGFMLMCNYNENSPIQEKFIINDIGYTYSNQFTRIIVVGRSENGKHPTGRMKVSKLIPYKNSLDTKYNKNMVSFHVTNEKNGIVEWEFVGCKSGNDIKVKRLFDFQTGELEFYCDLCRRNWNLIQLAKDSNLETPLERAFINDELMRRQGKRFIREKNGDIIYNDITRNQYGAPVYHEIKNDLYGNPIYNHEIRKGDLL